ncbi:hypothetical protein EV193_103434 [Herbihabitans rhizosphaerae]|uniref:Uncharacterized protein n=1 Tax=Herbihabitans rhizosphaerae TaxID=1872711 RepID=A0A4Q7KWN9_9PSEU|nr:hypothetical protein [Herbihabitans rhizosphaerae]RZS41115.1 hypothetical protein EV193_103434 [Herbihabitans rhizosphaerae]
MTDGFLVEEEFSGVTARFAVRVASAVDLTVRRGFAELAPAVRAEAAHRELVEYLAGLSAAGDGCAFEVRWCTGPTGPRLTLLGRARGANRAEVLRAAGRLRDRLLAAPPQVRVEPLVDSDGVDWGFTPFDPAGLVEVRRRGVIGRTERPGARYRSYVAVPPFGSGWTRWPEVVRLLRERDTPAMVSVGLEPVSAPAWLTAALREGADDLAELARPVDLRGTVTGGAQYPAEPFAAPMAALYRDAANRYAAPVFRLRVTVVDTAPGNRLAAAVAQTLRPDPPGDGLAVEAPATPRDRALAMESVGWLGVPRWGVYHAPDVSDLVRLQVELTDAAQAARAVWLPVATTGSLPWFPVTAPPAEAMVSSGDVHFHGDTTVEGDVFTGDKTVNPPQS